MARMIAHVPMGALCDQTSSKRGLIIIFTLLSTLTPLIVIWTSNYQILIAKSIVEGIAASGIGIFKGPFTLGIAGHDLFEQASTKTEMADHSGSFSSAVLTGIIAYYLYPNVVPMFYVVGVFGILSTISIASLPQYREEYDLDGTMHSVKAVNNEWARNSFHGLKIEDEDPEEIRQMGKKELEEESESIWEMFITQKQLSIFGLGIFFFHLGNAAILPLLGQVLVLEGGRVGIPYMAANIVLAQTTSLLGIKMFNSMLAKGYRINIPILIGFGALVPRVLIIIICLRWWSNPYAIIATQFLDGLGAGTNGIAVMRITKTMTEGSNRFGVAFAIIILCESIGGAFSNLISGYVVGASTYEIGFIFLLCTGAVSLYFIHAMKVESAFACEGKNGEKEKKSFPRMVDLSSKVQVKHDLTADGASNSDEKGKKSTPSINHINQSESENKETTEA
mmetsp:Transcript_352/g.323  ORF Transcript_352/g.323 Transcript_352/m.323 type:complete len:450 (+) Transcript_352:157-1506(+)